MKRTSYIVMVSSNGRHQRVYMSESGKRYVKCKDGYYCIENTPCIKFIHYEPRSLKSID